MWGIMAFDNLIYSIEARVPSICLIAGRLPSEGMESFDIDENGRFKIVYNQENTGVPIDLVRGRMEDVKVNVSRVVTGFMDNESIEIDARCIVVHKQTYVELFKIKSKVTTKLSLRSVKVNDDSSFEVKAKIETAKSIDLPKQIITMSQINSVKIEW